MANSKPFSGKVSQLRPRKVYRKMYRPVLWAFSKNGPIRLSSRSVPLSRKHKNVFDLPSRSVQFARTKADYRRIAST